MKLPTGIRKHGYEVVATASLAALGSVNVDHNIETQKQIGVQVEWTENAAATAGIRIDFFQEFRTAFDTIAYGSLSPALNAGVTQRVSFLVDTSGPEELRVTITNLDAAQAVTNVNVSFSVDMDE